MQDAGLITIALPDVPGGVQSFGTFDEFFAALCRRVELARGKKREYDAAKVPVGLMLLKLRELTPHGEWERRVSTLGLHRNTVLRWMREAGGEGMEPNRTSGAKFSGGTEHNGLSDQTDTQNFAPRGAKFSGDTEQEGPRGPRMEWGQTPAAADLDEFDTAGFEDEDDDEAVPVGAGVGVGAQLGLASIYDEAARLQDQMRTFVRRAAGMFPADMLARLQGVIEDLGAQVQASLSPHEGGG